MKENGIDKYSLFYKTDHHWTTETGLWATNVIANQLKDNYGIDYDEQKLDIKNYVVEKHSGFFLGYRKTRRFSIFRKRDFSLIYPILSN
jgi:hypothetical protein